jgi:predicted transcriptional regulator
MTTTLAQNSPKRRDRLSIMSEIMDIAYEGALKTQIMFRANLSFSQLTSYLNLLTATNLLSKTPQDGKEVYRITAKGKDFLTRHEEMMGLLASNQASITYSRSPLMNLSRRAYHEGKYGHEHTN